MSYAALFVLVAGTGIYGQLNGSTPQLLTKSTGKTLTVNDFITMTEFEYLVINQKTPLRHKGFFGPNGMWFVDRNGTDYLLIRKSPEQKKKDLAEAMRNANDTTDIVCPEGICLRKDQVRQQLETYEALMSYSDLIPSQIPGFAVMVSVFLLVGCVGIAGNMMILSAVLRSKSARNSTNILISSLAIADIFVLAICLPVQVIQAFFRMRAIFNKDLCRFFLFMRYFSVSVSVFTMTVMAIERYIAICYPLMAKSYCTVKNARRLVAVLWILSGAFCVPVVFAASNDHTDRRCRLKFGSPELPVAFHAVVAFFVLILPLAVMLPLYFKIFRVLWRSTQESDNLYGSSPKEPEAQGTRPIKARKQVIRMLVLVLLMFVLCWAPAVLHDLIRSIVALINVRGILSSTLTGVILNSLGICNSFINPLVYTAMSRQFQLYLKSMCCRKQAKEVVMKGNLSSTDPPSKSTVNTSMARIA